MGQEEHSTSDPEIARLQEKTRQGAKNVVKDILNDPNVQDMIKKAVLRESIINGLVMACLFLGLLKLFDVSKTVFHLDWTIDFLLGLVLTTISLGYMLKNLRKK
jgi:type III secretory pathway component EscT